MDVPIRLPAHLALSLVLLLLAPLTDLPGSRASGQPFAGGVFVAVGDIGGVPGQEIITGAGPGGGPHVKAFDFNNNAAGVSFFPYALAFTGGVRVAACDFDGDGRADVVTGAGPGGGPHVKVTKVAPGPVTELQSFFPYALAFTGGVFVACGDVNGDGVPDIITGAGEGGGPHVRVFSGVGLTELASFFPYSPAFTGGVRVAAGDIDGSGQAAIITGAGPSGGPHVRAFKLIGTTVTEVLNFFPYDLAFPGGVFVGVGINGDTGARKIVTGAGAGGGSHVKVFDVGATGTTVSLFSSFFAYDTAFLGGVTVAGATGGVVTGPGPGGGPDVRTFFDDGDFFSNFFAY
jgi:FG-GAP repeat